MEQWRDVVGFEGLYRVSDLGRVMSIPRPSTKGGILKGSRCGTRDYITLQLWKNGKASKVTVHSVVAAAWIGPRPDGHDISHKDEDNTNNAASNLCYLDKVTHHRRDKGRRVVRSDGKEYASMTEAAEDTGCFKTGIWRACNGRRKSAGGYSWRYADIES